ncbi:hypothetical protein WICMUC_000108 [Wickerhamomyces mucosus]|uniref:RING-type E3 ubiquitin transferase n=1 Tax=Wickerhamomyces mucosus TaxID=1378264 RepID=A0A9P8Q040_9ASCO|nr:hypothetical protein WICMUC_000108 [Wickerhamomyces mucosus]
MGQYTSRITNNNRQRPRPNASVSTSDHLSSSERSIENSSQRRRRSSTYAPSLQPPTRRRRFQPGRSRTVTNSAGSFIRSHHPLERLSSNPTSESPSINTGPISSPLTSSSSLDLNTPDFTPISSPRLSPSEPENPSNTDLNRLGSHHLTNVPSDSTARTQLNRSNSLNSRISSSYPEPGSNSPQNNYQEDDISFEHQTEMLARLLEVAATSTVLTLLGTTHASGRRFDNTTPTLSDTNMQDTPSGNDSTFQEFVQGLRNGLLSNELSRESRNMSFFRAFRFDHSNRSNNFSSTHTTSGHFNTPSSSSTGNLTSSAAISNDSADIDPNTGDAVVPVMIIGVRSIQSDSSSGADEDFSASTPILRARTSQSAEENTPDNDRVYSNNSDLLDNASLRIGNNHSRSNRGNDHSNNQRSWVIFVMGNTFRWNHPFLSAPTLMSDNPTYEDLLNLQELIGQAKTQVVSKQELSAHTEELFEIEIIESTTPFEKKTCHKRVSISEQERCHICLSEYYQNDVVRKLQNCDHFYHQDCIDQWLLNGKNNCPLCRSKGISLNAENETVPS